MLDELHTEILTCKKCDLYKFRTNAVPGEGNISADIMFVGEAPGEQEDLQGRPFVGAAGNLLTKFLQSIGLKREDVFIGNILKCRPPKNRDPQPEEMEMCIPYLIAQIALIKPKIIGLLGRHSLKILLDKQMKISEVHGKVFSQNNIYYIPLYHPAAALHRNSEQMIKMMLRDFKTLKMLVDKIKIKKGKEK